jgi:hypothetical protein
MSTLRHTRYQAAVVRDIRSCRQSAVPLARPRERTKHKPRGLVGLAGFGVSLSWRAYTWQVTELYGVSFAESNIRVRACPKRELNPHAVAGIHLPDVRVYQFRHSGTSAKTAKL